MATRSIVTYQPDVACDVCGRRLLRGERPDTFIGHGRRRIVCELCVPRATEEGWLRESDAHSASLRPSRVSSARSLLGRLRQRRTPGPEDGPRAGAEPAAARRAPRERSLRRRREIYEDDYEGDFMQGGADRDAHAPDAYESTRYAPEADAPDAYDPRSYEQGSQDGYLHQAYEQQPQGAPEGAYGASAAAHVHAGDSLAGHADDLLAGGHPAELGADPLAGQADPAFAADPAGALQQQTSGEAKTRRALAVFNASACAGRVAGIARALGQPSVSVRPVGDSGSRVAIVIAWELCWYRYEVDLGDEISGPRLAAEGMELDELPEQDRVANAAADERGELSLVL